MKARNTLIAAALLASLGLNACAAASPETSVASLSSTNWVLTQVNGQNALPDIQATVTFGNGLISGNDGCNQFGGSYSEDNGRLSVNQDLASSMMACPAPVMEQADALLKALGQAAAYQSDGQQLTVLDSSRRPIAQFSAQRHTLAGTTWLVTGVAAASGLEDAGLTLEFGADGTAHGSAGCNRFTARYDTAGQTLSLGPVGATRMACATPAEVMENEAAYLQALNTVTAYRMTGTTLELLTAEAGLAVTLVPAAP